MWNFFYLGGVGEGTNASNGGFDPLTLYLVHVFTFWGVTCTKNSPWNYPSEGATF